MNRTITVIMAAAVLVLTAVLQASAADPLKELAGTLSKGVEGDRKLKTAVLSFPYVDARQSKGAVLVQERLTTYLAANGKMEVIERKLIDKVLEEARLGAMGLIEAETIRHIGTLTGAEVIVTGTLTDLADGRTEVNARAINVQTGLILSAGQARIKKDWKESPAGGKTVLPPVIGRGPVVQIALLLDTSNSMDGLIAQTKSQLWKIVNELASSSRDGRHPRVQVALYEYGNNRLSAESGYIRRVMPFCEDLDAVSERLFGLTTNGGSEYCGMVVRESLQGLEWDGDDGVYKAIFIAGNEPFTQGPVYFMESLPQALRRGVVVNTIFCGPYQEGLATQWKAGAVAGGGDYMNIDSNREIVALSTPYDDEIARLGNSLNDTFIPYGNAGRERQGSQEKFDKAASAIPASGAPVERALFKAKAQYSEAADWDVVGMVTRNSASITSLKREELPADMISMSEKELQDCIAKKSSERQKIQSRINVLNEERRKYLAKAQQEQSGSATLDTAIISAVRSQAGRKNYTFK